MKKEQFKEKHGVGLGFMSFFTKACCVALQEWPSVNAKIDGDEMVYHDFCDISIAVSAPKGLVVPVIRNAEMLDFKGVESEVVRLATKARDNKLSIEEIREIIKPVGLSPMKSKGIYGLSKMIIEKHMDGQIKCINVDNGVMFKIIIPVNEVE